MALQLPKNGSILKNLVSEGELECFLSMHVLFDQNCPEKSGRFLKLIIHPKLKTA